MEIPWCVIAKVGNWGLRQLVVKPLAYAVTAIQSAAVAKNVPSDVTEWLVQGLPVLVAWGIDVLLSYADQKCKESQLVKTAKRPEIVP